MRILLLAGILLISATTFSQMAGRDKNRHGLSFTTGQNKHIFEDTAFLSKNWRTHISTGYTYVRYINFHWGVQTGVNLSTTRTDFSVNNNIYGSDQYPGAQAVIIDPQSNLSNSIDINKKPDIDLEEVAYYYPYQQGKSNALRDHIETEYSVEIPTIAVYSTNFKGAFRFNTKLGIITRINVMQQTGLSDEGIMGGLVYRNYLRLRNKKAANFSGQVSFGFEWNYVGNRSLVFDFSYRTNLTSIYKTGEHEQYLMIVTNDELPLNPQVSFFDIQARRHQLALTISTQF